MSEFFERPPADHSLIGRMIRAARLEPQLYAEVESDASATGQAAVVVLLAALAGGVASPGHPLQALQGALIALGLWYASAYLIYLVGARLLPEEHTRASFGMVLRAIGFASAPGVLRLLGIVADVRDLVLFIASMWTLVATVIAVRHVLSYSSAWRAIGVCAIPLLAQLMLVALLLSVAGGPVGTNGELDAPNQPSIFDSADEPPPVQGY